MTVLLHRPQHDATAPLNEVGFRLALSDLDPEALSAAVPPTDLSTRRARQTRIFQIGFNKCGTGSLYRFFQRAGITATRYNRGQLADTLHRNIEEGRKPLAGAFDRYVALTDIHQLTRARVIEGISYFRQLHAYYPSAYFILNTRDKEGWLRARLAHGDGAYARRYARALKLANEAAVVEHWSQDWDRHHQDVVDHFARHTGQLLVYDIKSGDPQALVDFLAPDFLTRASDLRHETESLD